MDKRNLNDEFEKALHIHNQGDLIQAESIYKKILIDKRRDVCLSLDSQIEKNRAMQKEKNHSLAVR